MKNINNLEILTSIISYYKEFSLHFLYNDKFHEHLNVEQVINLLPNIEKITVTNNSCYIIINGDSYGRGSIQLCIIDLLNYKLKEMILND